MLGPSHEDELLKARQEITLSCSKYLIDMVLEYMLCCHITKLS